jgi:hypothetical protein
MKHDSGIVWPVFEDEDIWRTAKQTVDGRDWVIGEAKGRPIDVAALGEVRVQVTSGQTSLEPMFPLKYRHAVSKSLRDFICAIEPDVHQFISVDISLRDGSFPPEPYYLINICNRVDAVDEQHTRMSRSSYGDVFLASGSNDRIALRDDEVNSMAIWIDARVVGWEFMSDRLHKRLKYTGCTRFDFVAAVDGELQS